MRPRGGPERGTQRGFTLVEVLVALFLMGLAMMAAAPLFVHAMRENAAGADLGSVGALAVQRMEILRATDFYSLAAGGSLTITTGGFSDATDPNFTTRWLIVANGTPATMKTISVRVVATRRVHGQPKEVTLSTLRAR